jgi:hypothetical protein
MQDDKQFFIVNKSQNEQIDHLTDFLGNTCFLHTINPKLCKLIEKMVDFLNIYHPDKICSANDSETYPMNYTLGATSPIDLDKFLENPTLSNDEIPFMADIMIGIFKFKNANYDKEKKFFNSDMTNFTNKMRDFLTHVNTLVVILANYNEKCRRSAQKRITSQKSKQETVTIPKKLKETYETVVPKYNIQFDFFKKHVLPRESVKESILPYYDMFVQLKQYDAKQFMSSKGVSIDVYVATDKVIKHHKTSYESKKSKKNYDGKPVINDTMLIIKVNKSVYRPVVNINYDGTNNPGGLTFGYDTKDELLCHLLTAIEYATIEDLKFEHVPFDMSIKNKKFGGCVIVSHDNDLQSYNLWIDLKLQHVEYTGILNSYNVAIMHHLTNGNFNNHSKLKKAYESPYAVNVHQVLSLYIVFQTAMTMRIKQLISQSKSIPNFQFACIECFRPECKKTSIYILNQKLDSNSFGIKCNFCKIAEFCLKCHLSSHAGDCEAPDEAIQEYILKNTRQCPGCRINIEKSEGCNHMHCTQCNTDFCWLCGVRYDRNEINNHYINNNSALTCLNLRG